MNRIQYRIKAILDDIRIYAISYKNVLDDIQNTVREAMGDGNLVVDLPKLDASEFVDEEFNFLPDYDEFLEL